MYALAFAQTRLKDKAVMLSAHHLRFQSKLLRVYFQRDFLSLFSRLSE